MVGHPRRQRDEFYIVVAGTGRYRMEDKRLRSSRTIWVVDAASNAAGSSAAPSGPYSLAMNATANACGASRESCGLGCQSSGETAVGSVDKQATARLGYTEPIGSGRDGG